MGIGTNSYGSVAEIEALCRRYTAQGIFGEGTNPTLIQVEGMIDRVSGIVNVLLAEAGFAVAVSQADAKLALDDFVVNQVVQLVGAANSHGIYAPGSEALRKTTPGQIILKEAQAFIGEHAAGFQALGATRTRDLTYGLACRTEDDAGEAIEPVFQRKMIGNVIVDWDDDG